MSDSKRLPHVPVASDPRKTEEDEKREHQEWVDGAPARTRDGKPLGKDPVSDSQR